MTIPLKSCLFLLLSAVSTASAKTLLTNVTDNKIVSSGDFKTLGALKWQSSGILFDGCSDSVTFPIAIDKCFSLQLSASPKENLQAPNADSPRQRIEFLTEGAADGATFRYSWKYYLSSKTGTTKNFFHLMQLLMRDGGPVIALDAVNDKVALRDFVRDCPAKGCPSIDLDDFTDRTTAHDMLVTFGPNGAVQYTVKDSVGGKTLLSYSATGEMGKSSTSLKFGMYRLAVDGMTAARAALGDFTVKKL
ncbi:hypothetical protein MIND_00873400 [Mycena indigotica]|uniref:Uncharacterized protein n=1 Tax=Mycena indigotica TaxID=2126181 RepID=A0A8H6SJ32_9AGAR|nr:uncharacterized protein MIND_00873400 [Mycena indigotica]KAF7299247.1 hypothetical protein MIND_00873400 [Mycena indigotica]